jgi:uncharacterized membrane protein YkvA (DUF1232 family)
VGELKITFKLEDKDLRHLKRVMRAAAEAAKHQSKEKIIESASAIVQRAREAKPPEYVLDRIETLEDIATMLQDREWRLPNSVGNRVYNALAYFANPQDLIPDQIPGLGFLDDAIMIELVAQEFRHEIAGYREFRRYRERARRRLSGPERESLLQETLVERRRQIRARIQAKRGRAADRPSSAGRRFKIVCAVGIPDFLREKELYDAKSPWSQSISVCP